MEELSPFPAKKESKIDKIRSYYKGERELTPELEETRLKLVKANALLCEGNSHTRTVQILSKNNNISERQAYNIVKDSIRLFGEGFETNSKGEKHILYEGFMEDARLAREAGDHRSAIRAREKAAQIKNAFSDKIDDARDLAKLFNVNITFTTDPAALKPTSDTIDITGEEV